MRIIRHIDVVNFNTINAKDFKEKYLKPQKPVIIKDLIDQYPASKKWSLNYMKEFCGDVIVDVFDNNNNKNTSSAYTNADMKMKFNDFIDTITKDEPSNLRMFLFNMFKKKPTLRKDFPCPKIFKGMLGRIGFMFFGGKDIKVRIHQDIDMSNVLLTQFHGKKRVLLISPKFSALLYRLPYNTYSLINPDKPDYNKYPCLEYVEAQECILEHGDTLFMPSGYWHYITYLEGGFAVSYRKLALNFNMKLQGLLNLIIYMHFDKLMNRMIGDKWLAKKEYIAEMRANKAIMSTMVEPQVFYGMQKSWLKSELNSSS